MSKYVRREIRTLSADDLDATLTAMQTIYTVA